jgi:hypothetical protein
MDSGSFTSGTALLPRRGCVEPDAGSPWNEPLIFVTLNRTVTNGRLMSSDMSDFTGISLQYGVLVQFR